MELSLFWKTQCSTTLLVYFFVWLLPCQPDILEFISKDITLSFLAIARQSEQPNWIVVYWQSSETQKLLGHLAWQKPVLKGCLCRL